MVPDCSAECAGKLQGAASRVSQVSLRPGPSSVLTASDNQVYHANPCSIRLHAADLSDSLP